MKQVLIVVPLLTVAVTWPLSAQVPGLPLHGATSQPRTTGPVSMPAGFGQEVRADAATKREGQRSVADAIVAYVAPDGMTPEQLVDRALTLNADLLATRQRTTEAHGLLRQAGARPNPSLEVGGASGSVLGSPGEHEFEAGLTQTIELGGKRSRRLDVGRAELELAGRDVATRERDLATDIENRYVEALTAVRNLESSARLVTLMEKSYGLAAARVAQGEAAPLEQGLLRADLARLRADRLLFESQVRQALLDLKTLAGLDVDYPLRLRDDWRPPPMTTPPEQLVAVALASRPDLAAARQEEQVRAADVRLAQAEGTPDLTAFVRYGRTASQFNQLGLGPGGLPVPIRDLDNVLSFGGSVALPLGNRNQGNVQAGTARAAAARLRRQYLEETVRREVRAAYLRYEAGRQAHDALERDGVNQANENVNMLRASYELGEARLLDLLAEQRRAIEIERAYNETSREYFLARVELERVLGTGVR